MMANICEFKFIMSACGLIASLWGIQRDTMPLNANEISSSWPNHNQRQWVYAMGVKINPWQRALHLTRYSLCMYVCKHHPQALKKGVVSTACTCISLNHKNLVQNISGNFPWSLKCLLHTVTILVPRTKRNYGFALCYIGVVIHRIKLHHVLQ